jgi:hypothetical protein
MALIREAIEVEKIVEAVDARVDRAFVAPWLVGHRWAAFSEGLQIHEGTWDTARAPR